MGMREQAALSAAIAAGIAAYNEAMEPMHISCWFMHDNHTFTRLNATTIAELVEEARGIAKRRSYGSLCPVTVMRGEREVRQVGPMVHFHELGDAGDPKAVAEWIAACESDPDIRAALSGQEG